jgi:hypothetical protein
MFCWVQSRTIVRQRGWRKCSVGTLTTRARRLRYVRWWIATYIFVMSLQNAIQAAPALRIHLEISTWSRLGPWMKESITSLSAETLYQHPAPSFSTGAADLIWYLITSEYFASLRFVEPRSHASVNRYPVRCSAPAPAYRSLCLKPCGKLCNRSDDGVRSGGPLQIIRCRRSCLNEHGFGSRSPCHRDVLRSITDRDDFRSWDFDSSREGENRSGTWLGTEAGIIACNERQHALQAKPARMSPRSSFSVVGGQTQSVATLDELAHDCLRVTEGYQMG